MDWGTILNDAIQAAKGVLGGAWAAVQQGVAIQINSLVQTAEYIDNNKATMTPGESQLLASQQKMALQNVLLTYEAVGLAAAQNTVAAVVGVILKEVPALIGFL